MSIATQSGTPLVVPIPSHLIHSNRREFKQRILDELERGRKHIVIDCTRAKYIDAAGLGVLFSLNKSALNSGAQFMLAGLNDDVRSLFAITKLEEVITIAETVGAAIAKLAGSEG